MIHTLIALIAQAAIGLLTGDWRLGAFLASGVFIGREHAQAEYRWIETYGLHVRANMPWWGGFDPKVWNLKSLLDWLLPVLFVCAVVIITGA